MRDELTTTALHQREALRFVLSGLFALAALLGCKNRAGPAKQISFDGRGGAVGLWSSRAGNEQSLLGGTQRFGKQLDNKNMAAATGDREELKNPQHPTTAVLNEI